MNPQTFTKPDVTDDLLPAPCAVEGPSAVPPAYRIFTVANFSPRGGFTGQICIEGQVFNTKGEPIRGATFDARLFLFIDGIWKMAGRPALNVGGGNGPQAPFGSGLGYTSGRFFGFLFGGLLDASTPGFLQITNVVTPEPATKMIFNVNGAEPATSSPRNESGANEIVLAPPSTWKTLGAFTNPGARGQLTANPTPVEQYVLLQADANNPVGAQVEIVDGTILGLGEGYQLDPGQSVQWPTRDASTIWILTDQAAGAVKIRATRF